MQILNTQQGRGESGSIQAVVKAPLSPASSVETENSPTPATTATACMNGLQEEAVRPTPCTPHSNVTVAVASKTDGVVLPSVTSSLGELQSPTVLTIHRFINNCTSVKFTKRIIESYHLSGIISQMLHNLLTVEVAGLLKIFSLINFFSEFF